MQVSFEQYFPVVLFSTSSKVILSFERVEKRKVLSSFLQSTLFFSNPLRVIATVVCQGCEKRAFNISVPQKKNPRETGNKLVPSLTFLRKTETVSLPWCVRTELHMVHGPFFSISAAFLLRHWMTDRRFSKSLKTFVWRQTFLAREVKKLCTGTHDSKFLLN